MARVYLVGTGRGIDQFGQLTLQLQADSLIKLAHLGGGRTPVWEGLVGCKLTDKFKRADAEAITGRLVCLCAKIVRYKFRGRGGAEIRGWNLHCVSVGNPLAGRRPLDDCPVDVEVRTVAPDEGPLRPPL